MDCLFCFPLEIPFLGKFGPKSQNCQFKLKFGTCTNSNLQNSMVIVTFSLWPEIPYLGKFGPENQNCQFKLNLAPKLIRIYRIQWCSRFLFFFNHKYTSWANLVQKSKIVCSKWSLTQRLIRIFRIQWWCLFYLF